MPRGRPPLGSAHVDSLDGPEESKQRLRVLLDTISGACTIDDACRKLGVSPARLHEMRQQALAGALAALAPGRPGRPARQPEPGEERIRELEHELDEAKIDLQAARTRLLRGDAEIEAERQAIFEPGYAGQQFETAIAQGETLRIERWPCSTPRATRRSPSR